MTTHFTPETSALSELRSISRGFFDEIQAREQGEDGLRNRLGQLSNDQYMGEVNEQLDNAATRTGLQERMASRRGLTYENAKLDKLNNAVAQVGAANKTRAGLAAEKSQITSGLASAAQQRQKELLSMAQQNAGLEAQHNQVNASLAGSRLQADAQLKAATTQANSQGHSGGFIGKVLGKIF